MKYHYTKPTEYSSMYGQLYECNHPAYNHCTLYLIGDKGLAVIQQRYDKKSKWTISNNDSPAINVESQDETHGPGTLGNLFR